MRILLDECIDEEFRHCITGHECQTCRYAGFKGLTNGQLLAAAEEAGYHALITVDRNMRFQQSMRGRAISLVVLESLSTSFENLAALVPKLLDALEGLQPGEVTAVRM